MTDPPKPNLGTHGETGAIDDGTRSASRSFAPGTVVARRYRIDAYLAAGGMGQVYRARDLELNVPLAIKTIHPEIAMNPAALRRFKQEVLLARSVTHPNVCRIFDLWRDDPSGVSFLTMEFLDGETLASRIGTRGALATQESLPLVRQMADALDAAHRAGVVHRDFKSPNVMVVPNGNGGRAVITDFGLALTVGEGVASAQDALQVRAADVGSDGPETPTAALDPAVETVGLDNSGVRAGKVVGTPAYMSPEQVRGDVVGPASDLYALGVVLFEMSTGRLPFQGSTPLETAQLHLVKKPPNPRSIIDIEGVWESAILRLLAKEPSERFATAHDVVLALEGQTRNMPARHSLPAERDAFVGRTEELEAIASCLELPHIPDSAIASERTRFLTLQGLGGTGKTRLAQKYGWDSLPRWPGGVWFCDLSEARTLDGIVAAVASSLGVALGKEEPITHLGHAIGGRERCLVILDNFEHVMEHGDATLGRWLAQPGEASFLVTSRERLQLPEETVLVLDPLDPDTQGVELFELRAQKHLPSFVVDQSNQERVEEIVKSLDGLPLAIELAAARLRMLNLDQLRERLGQRFKTLSGGRSGRHATLRSTLDWSWDLLQPWEQSAMAQVSVFEGGFTLEAAEAVVDLSPHEEDLFVLDVIQSLVDKSWLRTIVACGALRFDMYATVQEYASGKLREAATGGGLPSTGQSASDAPSLRDAEARHSLYFSGMGTEETVASLESHGGVPKRAALALEIDNLLSGCRRAIDGGDEIVAANCYCATEAVLRLCGPFSILTQLGQEVLARTQDPGLRGRVLLILGDSEDRLGRTTAACEHFETAFAIYRRNGLRWGEGLVLSRLASANMTQGRMEEAREYYEAALAIHREVGHRRAEGISVGNLGHVHRSQGRTAEAYEHYETALTIHREVGDRRFEGIALAHLGLLNFNQGRMDLARAQYEQALAIAREGDDRRSEGIALGYLGTLSWQQGRTEEARAHLEAALDIHRKTGGRRFEAATLGNLGILRMNEGRFEEAREHFETSLALHREAGDRRAEGAVLQSLGDLHRHQGEVNRQARATHEAALAIAREVGDRAFEGDELSTLGTLFLEQGRWEDAHEHLESALDIHREVGKRFSEAVALLGLARLQKTRGRLTEAGDSLAEAESIASELAVEPESQLALKLAQVRNLLNHSDPDE